MDETHQLHPIDDDVCHYTENDFSASEHEDYIQRAWRQGHLIVGRPLAKTKQLEASQFKIAWKEDGF